MARIAGIQRHSSYQYSRFLQTLEYQLLGEYSRVLHQEELFWFQKSRAQWMSQGDRNTRFYHVSTVVRRKHNKIESLKLDSGEWCTQVETLKSHALNFYIQLYGPLEFLHISLPLRTGSCPFLEPSDVEHLLHPVMYWETTKAVKSFSSFKALGPDGLNPLFFQKYWHVVEAAVHQLVSSAFRTC